MSDLYKRIEELCKERKITITTMCKESGASRASLSDLKMGRKQGLSADTLNKIAKFFSVSVDYLLGNVSDPFFVLNNDAILANINSYEESEKAPTATGERSGSHDVLDDVDIAFYGDYKELTEDDKATVRDMVRIMRERRSKKQEQ